ncbi:fibroin heavy chain [Drosophila novamexicana]|uniref:fibroin heavy chain n=1 Tax=Drosophila novamexicana TaxID=47314 RepID=UPI0011E5AD52|nr:fibroin heavy chain [Drosophila novamexicana]
MSGPPGPASRPPTEPPCPCTKCKEQARAQNAQNQAPGVQNGRPSGMSARPMPYSNQGGPYQGSSPRPGQRMGPQCLCGIGMGPGMGQGMGPRMGPGMQPGRGSMRGPGMGPRMDSRRGSGIGSGRGSGMGQGMGPENWQGMDPRRGSGRGSGMGQGMSPENWQGMEPGMGAKNWQGMEPGMEPGMSSDNWQGMDPGMGPDNWQGMDGEMGPDNWQGMEPGMDPGMGSDNWQGMDPGMGAENWQGMEPGMDPGMGSDNWQGMDPGMGPDNWQGMDGRMGPENGQGMDSGMGPENWQGMEPGMETDYWQGNEPGMGPDNWPETDPGIGPENWQGMEPGMETDYWQGMDPGIGSGRGSGVGSGRGLGVGSGRGSGVGQANWQGMVGPEGEQDYGYGAGPGMDMGYDQYQPASRRGSEMCRCVGSQGNDPAQEGKPGAVAFGVMSFGRKSSLNEHVVGRDDAQIPRTACSVDYSQYGTSGPVAEGLMRGRDTLGLPVHLQGNKGLLNAVNRSTCSDHLACDELCGINTDCFAGCKKYLGSRASSSNQVSGGVRICNNDFINAIATFLMEVLAILVFFAICTFTFWITLGYYIVQLMVDLKNADRNVHVAVGTVFGLLVLAFAITLATHSGGPCYNRAHAISRSISATASGSIASCQKCNQAVMASAKRVCAGKCKVSGKPKPMPKAKVKAKSYSSPSCSVAKVKPQHKSAASRSRGKYTDCQGRKIFDRSRRNAVLTEMKQPPTWLLWLRDSANSIFCRG